MEKNLLKINGGTYRKGMVKQNFNYCLFKKNCSSNSINLCAHRLNSNSYKKDQLHGRKGEMYIKVVLTRIC